MEEGETVSTLSRKDIRKQKLMEYLTAKGKLKPPSTKSFAYDNSQAKKPVGHALKTITGKENKADTSRHNVPKGQTSEAQKDSVRKAFSVIDKVNSKGNILRKQNTKCSSSTTGQEQPKLTVKPMLTKTYTIVSSKSNANVAGYLKKHPNTGTEASIKPPLKGASTIGVKTNSKLGPNGALSGPVKSVSIRMSLCPLVKTRTGLTPAMIQPRNLIHVSGSAAGTIPATLKKGQSSTVSSTTQRSARAVSSTAVVVTKVQDKSNSKSLQGKYSNPTFKSQISGGPKSTSSKYTAPPSKPAAKVTTTKTAGLSASHSMKPRPQCEKEKNSQPYKVMFQTSARPASRCSSTSVSGIKHSTLTSAAMRKEPVKKSDSSAKHPACSQAGVKRPRAPVVSKTLPQPSRTISLTGQTSKAPKAAPQTEGKKRTTAQEERIKKLQEWREAKGISYKRPPMQTQPQVRRTVSVPQPFWTTISEEDEAHTLISAVDKSLADCIKLLGEGCTPDQVNGIISRLPAVSQKFAKYWICRARLMEKEGNLNVLPLFEEAVRVVLEPVDELRTVVFEILKKKDEIQASEEKEREEDDVLTNSPAECSSDPTVTPKPVKALIWGERGDSSVVKYKITATPGGSVSKQREPAKVNGQELRFFTPVRRSVRIEKASLRYPASLQDHDLCVTSYNELVSKSDKEVSEQKTSRETSPSDEGTQMFVYRENEALKDKMFVKLVFDDAV